MESEPYTLIFAIVVVYSVCEFFKWSIFSLLDCCNKRNPQNQLLIISENDEQKSFIDKQKKENQINEQKLKEFMQNTMQHLNELKQFFITHKDQLTKFRKAQDQIFQQIFSGIIEQFKVSQLQIVSNYFVKLYNEMRNLNSVQSNKQQIFIPDRLDQQELIILLVEENLKLINSIVENKTKEFIERYQSPPNLPLIQQDEKRKKRAQEIIFFLYEQSSNKRYVEPQYRPFIRDEYGEGEIFKNYGIRSSDQKSQLRKICNRMRYARGDGNCFYTSLGYQYLMAVLQFDQKQFDSFLDHYLQSDLPMIINIDQNRFDNPLDQKYLLLEFLYRLQELRQKPIEIRAKAFQDQFAAYDQFDEVIDGCFYGLSTIFFRNLANKAIEKSEMVNIVFDRQNLLIWEEMCNSNEIIIQSLAAELNLHVQLLFFDNAKFQLEEYEAQNQHKIILLIRPGHYNIGILEKVEQQELQY